MICSRQSRLRAFLLAAIVAAGAALHTQADVVAGAEDWTIETGVAIIGCGEPGLPIVPSGPDDFEVISEKPDNIILQWDFNTIHDRDSIYTVPGMDKHFIRGGDIHGETRTNFNGRSCDPSV